MEKTAMLAELDAATAELINHIKKVPDAWFDIKPSAESWSVAQVGEHLVMLETLVNKAILSGDTTERPLDNKVAVFRSALSDHTSVYTAPPMLLPSDVPQTKATIIAGLTQQRNGLKAFAQDADLSLTPQFKHPSLGRLTQTEWIFFVIYHAQRHLRQIDGIMEKLSEKAER